ncbi:DNA polymerase III subunit delta' [Magnetococcales bacterium HHB-1]
MQILPFKQILGQENALQVLRTSLSQQRLGHAYLFYGPLGVGKSATVYSFAQTLFCRQSSMDDQGFACACGDCAPCRRLMKGTHPDFTSIEVLEGKKMISVEQVREMSQFLSLTPLEERSPWKVVLIEDAALMTHNAANALLKTLEEPSEKTLIFLVTQRRGDLLPTILSRCIMLPFSALSASDVEKALLQQQIEPRIAKEASSLAEGSVSQGLEYCQEAFRSHNLRFQDEMRTISEADIEQICGISQFWSDRETYPFFQRFFLKWLRRRLHDLLKQPDQKRRMPAHLRFIQWSEQLLLKPEQLNVNRQLVLESLLIRFQQEIGGSSKRT